MTTEATMTTEAMRAELDRIAGDLVELSMYRLSDNPAYTGLESGHSAWKKINSAADLLSQAAMSISKTKTQNT